MVTRLGTILGTALGTALSTMSDVTVDTNMYGVSNITASNFYATPNPGGEAAGGATGMFEAIMFRVPSAPSSVTRALGGRDNNASPGHGWATTGVVAQLLWGVQNTGGTRTNAPIYTSLPANYGKIVLGVGVWLDGQYSKMYVGGVQVGTQTTHALTMATGPLASTIGKRIADSLPATGLEFFGLLQGTGVPTPAEISTHYAACIAARKLVPLTGATAATTFTFDVTSAAVGGVLPNAIGTMVKNGSPTLVTEPNPSWV